jgi:hypothetical protein
MEILMADSPHREPWSVESVKSCLESTAQDGVSSAQVFLDGNHDPDLLGETVSNAIERVRQRLGVSTSVVLGRVSRMANAVAVKGDADVIAELLHEDDIKAVLPSIIPDILPRPSQDVSVAALAVTASAASTRPGEPIDLAWKRFEARKEALREISGGR